MLQRIGPNALRRSHDRLYPILHRPPTVIDVPNPSTTLPRSALNLPAAREAIRIITQLREAGFVAVLAGGCVRDALLGRVPKDFDVATDATPDSVREVFGKRNTLAFGASFGVIGVLPPKRRRPSNSPDRPSSSKETKLEPTEVATFRADGNYSDGRRPDSVVYGDCEADALRRDFTINGMFYDPVAEQVLDYVGGLQDLQDKHLRTIGDPARRFDEDKLRMLRAVRFVTTLGLSVQPETLAAIQQHSETIKLVSGERIGAEMQRILNQPSGHIGLHWLVETRLSDFVWPDLHAMKWPLLEQRYARLDSLSFETTLATAHWTLHGSTANATKDLNERSRQWKLSTAQSRAIDTALRDAPVLLDCESTAWSQLQPLLIDRDIETTMTVAKAIADPDQTAGVRRAEHELQRSDRPLDPPPLLTGNDLIENGISPGPQFRKWLSELRRAQLDGDISDFETAMKWIRCQSS